MGNVQALVWAALAALAMVAGCGQSTTGRACSASDPCPDSHHCIPDVDGDGRCMADCTGSDDTLCSDGAVCASLMSGEMACWSGGRTPIGGECTGHSQCVRGGLCVGLVMSPTAMCFQGCNNIGGVCPSGGTCQMTIEGSGFCSR